MTTSRGFPLIKVVVENMCINGAMSAKRCEKHDKYTVEVTVEALFFGPEVDTIPLSLSVLALGVLTYDLETTPAAYNAVARATLSTHCRLGQRHGGGSPRWLAMVGRGGG